MSDVWYFSDDRRDKEFKKLIDNIIDKTQLISEVIKDDPCYFFRFKETYLFSVGRWYDGSGYYFEVIFYPENDVRLTSKNIINGLHESTKISYFEEDLVPYGRNSAYLLHNEIMKIYYKFNTVVNNIAEK